MSRRSKPQLLSNMEHERYIKLVDALLDTDTGLDRWAWMRRRARRHYEVSTGGELEGSSDVSGYLFDLWRSRGEDSLNDNFGWWINGEICDLMDIPRTRATEQYHNADRS